MELSDFLEHLNGGKFIEGGSEVHLFMHGVSQSAIKICSEINGGYHTPDELRRLMSELTGSDIDETFGMFPPFFSDCGKNIHIGKKFLSTRAASFRIRAVSSSVMVFL